MMVVKMVAEEATMVLDQCVIDIIGCYFVEGVWDAKNQILDELLDFSVKSVNEITEDGRDQWKNDWFEAQKLLLFCPSEILW